MKFRFLFTAVIFLLSFAKSYAICNPSFTWTQTSNNTIVFINTSTGAGSPTYYWHFGDGNTDHITNPTNFYSVPGTYWVCLTMYDSIHHPCATYCDSVVITGIHHCNLALTSHVTNASCGTCADGGITLSIGNGTPPFTFNWSDGSNNHFLAGVLPGVYSVCVTDSNNCTACDTFHVGNHATSGSCHASFSIHADTSVAHHYLALNNSSGTAPISYLWSWGDGSYDTVPHPGHGYVTAGYYTICLYISDGAGCTDSMCISYQLNHSFSVDSFMSINVFDAVSTAISNPKGENNFAIYPNPADDFLNITANSGDIFSVSIYNSLGEKIFSAQNEISNIKIETSNFSDGLYLVQIKSSNQTFFQKITKQ